MTTIPKITFNNGNEIPIIGLGTWKSKPGEVGQAVKDAIDVGYRHIDCARVYGNEDEVGIAIAEKIAKGVVQRKDLFITSKLWNTHLRPEAVEPALRKTLLDLQLEYVDLYLIHWPFGFKEGDALVPMGPQGMEFSDYDYIDTWKAMEAIHKKGLAKSIGVSNFNSKQIARLLEISDIAPACNQIECHPYLNQRNLIDFCKSKGIQIVAYSPLGSSDRPYAKPSDPMLLKEPTLKALADKHKKSPAQIALKFQVQRGIVTIPKSVNKERLVQNLDVFDFKLSSDELTLIEALGRNFRMCDFEGVRGHKYYPFGFVE